MDNLNYSQISSMASDLPTKTPTAINKNEVVFAPTNTNNIPENPKKFNLGIFLIPILIITLVAGLVIAGINKFDQEKKALSSLAMDQILKLQELESSYKQTIALIRGYIDNSDAKSANQVLGAFTRASKAKAGEVLSLEDDPAMKFTRQYIQVLKNNLNKIEEIDSNNQKFKQEIENSLIYKIINSANISPLSSSEAFVDKSKATLNYVKTIEELGLEINILAIEFGSSINETILRGADDASVEKLKLKLEEIKDIKAKMERIDLTDLSDELKIKHQKDIDSFDNEISPFVEIYEALKFKDIALLQKALISIESDLNSATETGLTEQINFWSGEDTLSYVEETRKLWINYRNGL